MSRQGQISVEFMTQVSILLTVYIIVMGSFYYYSNNVIVTREYSQQACFKVSSAFDSAVIGENGFTSQFNIPSSVNEKPIRLIQVSNQSYVTIDWVEGEFSCSILTQNITTGYLFPGSTGVVSNKDGALLYASIKTDKESYLSGETVYATGNYFYNSINVSIINLSSNLPVAGYPKLVYPLTNGTANDTWTAQSGRFMYQYRDSMDKNYLSTVEFEVT